MDIDNNKLKLKYNHTHLTLDPDGNYNVKSSSVIYIAGNAINLTNNVLAVCGSQGTNVDSNRASLYPNFINPNLII